MSRASRYALREFDYVLRAKYEYSHGDLLRALNFAVEEFESDRVPKDPDEAREKYRKEASEYATARDRRVYGPLVTEKMGMITETELPLPPLGLRRPRHSYFSVSTRNLKLALRDKQSAPRKPKTATPVRPRITIVPSEVIAVEEVQKP